VSAVVLDTSAYSAYFRGHAGLTARLQRSQHNVLPAIVIGELRFGFLGGAYRRENEQGLAAFLASPRSVVAPVSAETAERYAVIRDGLRRRGTPFPINDVWIAACAMQLGLPVLTLDRHFLQVPQVLVEIVGGS
jgi:tRNA(fMet)-specific endonuclease VapC